MERLDRIRGDVDQLKAAIRDHDGDAAEMALMEIAKKDPEAAAALKNGLEVEGLKEITGMG